MKARFITSGKIEYKFSGLSLYESIKQASSGKKFPGLSIEAKKEVLAKARLMEKPRIIIYAPSAQAKETAQILGEYFNVPVIEEIRLLPLKFDISGLMSEEEFNVLDDKAFDRLRAKFLEAFFEDKLLEDNQEVKNRFEYFKKYLKDNFKKGGVLFISHAFLIKLLQIYSLVGDRMYEDKKELFRLFDTTRPPMGRLEEMKIDFGKLTTKYG